MKKIWIYIMVLIAVIAICIPIVMLLMAYNNHIWKYTAAYEEYPEAFNTVKDFVESKYSDEPDKYLTVSRNNGERITLYDPDTKEYLHLPDDVQSSLETICLFGFPHKDSMFDIIRIQNDRISFCILNGQYALVYSPAEKPSWVNAPNEDDTVRVKSIGDGWYHVVKK